MTNGIQLLCITAASIGIFHTLAGPDHYLPFIMMSRARGWHLGKTVFITFFCGVGHVLSSVILGFVGIAFGVALHKLEFIESIRGDLAAWALTAFGFVYMIWGIHKAIKGKLHTHRHFHEDGSLHDHEHSHEAGHMHVHDRGKASITPWVLFIVFVLGPCEPLIPILMYPAARESIGGLAVVVSAFSVATIGTMLATVVSAHFGLARVNLRPLERYTHVTAGAAILLCGLAILFLGL